MRKTPVTLLLIISFLANCSAEPRVPRAVKAEKTPQKRAVSTGDSYLTLLTGSKSLGLKVIEELDRNWQLADAPMLMEVNRFAHNREIARELHTLLQKKSGKTFAAGSNEWQKWLWSQNYQEHPDYPEFKGKLYRQIDPAFKKYFHNNPKSTIRFDEIRWGGVIQDGIPPLRNPKMISAKKASYLADSDLVFGIAVGDDFRAYPKRILAWHEMFTDTIQGIPLAGVY